jgi:hypothetical protein
VISGVLRQWFEESDEIEALERLETDAVADRERVVLSGMRRSSPLGGGAVNSQVMA